MKIALAPLTVNYGDNDPAAGLAGEITLATARVTGFEQTSGNPQWREASIERLRNASFTFDDGDFIVRFPTAGANKVLRGTHRTNGQTITFSAEGRSSSSVALTTTSSMGQSPFAARPVLRITYVSGNGLGAVVNGTALRLHRNECLYGDGGCHANLQQAIKTSPFKTGPTVSTESAKCGWGMEASGFPRSTKTGRGVAPKFGGSSRSAVGCRSWRGSCGRVPRADAGRSGRGSDGRRSTAGGASRSAGKRCRRPRASSAETCASGRRSICGCPCPTTAGRLSKNGSALATGGKSRTPTESSRSAVQPRCPIVVQTDSEPCGPCDIATALLLPGIDLRWTGVTARNLGNIRRHFLFRYPRFRYSPTISRTFSTNCGSLENLKFSTRWGCNPKAGQIRTMASASTGLLAIKRCSSACCWPVSIPRSW